MTPGALELLLEVHILDEMEKGNNFKFQKVISTEPNGASPQKAISFGSHKAILECSPALVDRDGPNPCPNIERPTATNDESENGNYEPPKPTDKMGLNYESQLVAFFPNTEAQPKASSSRRPRWKSVTAILNVTPRIYRRHKKKSSEDSRLPKG
ncbi:hypothetical protein Ancab_023752 [Ancistrocladus abbreviatus]